MSLESNNHSDEHLLKRLKENDAGAFRIVFEKYHNFLCNSSFRILQNQEDAKDVVQAVFIHLWDKRKKLKIDNLKPYLHRSTINKSLNHLEKISKHRSVLLENAQHVRAIGITDTSELESSISKAILLLPPTCRLVFTLSRFDELKNAEIASHLMISIKAVEKHITKAIKMLRENLKEHL